MTRSDCAPNSEKSGPRQKCRDITHPEGRFLQDRGSKRGWQDASARAKKKKQKARRRGLKEKPCLFQGESPGWKEGRRRRRLKWEEGG